MGGKTKSRGIGRCEDHRPGQRGQAAMEMAIMIPVLMMLMFGAYQLARVFYTYHTLQKAFRGGAGMLAHASGVDYCQADPVIANAQNFVVYGSVTPNQGSPVVQGLTTDMVQVVAERIPTGSTSPGPCPCDTGGGPSGDPDSCDILNGGRAPDFVVVNDDGVSSTGFPVSVLFPFVSLGTGIINLQVSVRMAVTGD